MRFGKDFYSGLILSLFGVLMFFESQKIRRLRFDVLDNTFFPSVATILLVIFSVALVIHSLLSKEKPKPIVFEKPLRVILFLVSFLVYILLMEPVGFVLSSIIFVFVSCLIISWPIKIKTTVYSAIFAIATSFSVWYVFAKVLRLVLP
ncbi:tripartite tricarboxylate transporter TctB family protein [Pseudothermotoga sp.]|nr:tripartite tricarboxylate transporter TctB family protein [Pseudothermotoga sp.]MCX7812436.1 tripartite tricarboxylate transporter TctB family protein [Pseudothermotoga sp.]MDW8140110.1 tripartite tricarboxylate transporter TctB family protein [Pseudothermotoga sp.]